MTELKLIGTDRAKCPACGKDCSIRSHHPDKSGLWQHYFGGKCKRFRNINGGEFPNGVDLALMIKRANNIGRKMVREAKQSQEDAERERKAESEAQKHRKHSLTGGFLMEIVDQLNSALDMMEPYYKQCDANADGHEMIARLEHIIATRPASQ